jgi:hypothetical protein
VTVVASVEEDARNLVHINAVATVMVGVREVPATAFLVAIAVEVVRVIAHRQQRLLPAGLQNVSGSHVARNLDSVELNTLVHEVVPLTGPWRAIGVLVPVMAISPAMGAACVEQRSMAVRTCVEEGAPHNIWRYAVVPVVTRVREVPATSGHDALAIIVVSVVADRLHLLRHTGLVDVVPVHMSVHAHTEEVEDAICQIGRGLGPLCAERVHVAIAAIPPPVCASGVFKRPSMMMASVEERTSHL